MNQLELRKNVDKGAIALFFLALWLPLIGAILHIGTSSSKSTLVAERRLQAELPTFEWSQRYFERFPRKFEAYFSDRFGFREYLIYGHNRAVIELFETSPSPAVILGKGGWLFFAEEREYNRSLPFKSEELEAWKRLLECRRDWLASRNIPYLFVFVPNKVSVYPEFMPDADQHTPAGARLNQLINYLRQHSTISILNLTEPIQRSKGINRLYQKTDTHWNELGAFVASQEIIKEVRKSLPSVGKEVSIQDIKITESSQEAGDLAHLIKLQSMYSETNLAVQLPEKKAIYAGILQTGAPNLQQELLLGVQGITIAFEVKDPSLPKTVFFGDSFGQLLLPFLPEHFSRTAYKGGLTFDPKIVEQERPNIVIQEIVERHLKHNHAIAAQIKADWAGIETAPAACRAGS